MRMAALWPANFYPRPPRGGRPSSTGYGQGHHEFLSTPSARRATRRGVRKYAVVVFLSTPSARRATKNYLDITWQDDISIHALREEGDPILKHQRGWHDISIHALREEGDFFTQTKAAVL